MPGCCVPYCFNSTEKGFSMRSFPSNVKRRAIWMENINIHSGHQSRKWGATKNLFVCETHFSAEMWENVRVDGKKKLKVNAVPTVFYPSKSKDILAVEKNADIRDDLVEVEILSTSSKRLLTDIDTVNDVKRFRKNVTDEMDIPTSDSMTSASSIDTMKVKELDEAKKKLERTNTIIRKMYKTNRNLRQRVRQLRNCIKLYKEQRFSVAQDLLQQVFYKDQIEYLTAKYKGRSVRSIRAWTNETIKKALRLKHICGDNGYRELLCQGFPLPSTRTLRRRLECITFKDGICNEVFDLLGEKVLSFPDERYKDACICLDEMSLTLGQQIDPCINQSIGYATIPDKYGNPLI